jgi:hypothetical protein
MKIFLPHPSANPGRAEADGTQWNSIALNTAKKLKK